MSTSCKHCDTLKQVNEIYYESEYGYILGKRKNNYLWVNFFVIYPEFRGKGLARELAKQLPKRCKLMPWPLFNMKGDLLDRENLIKFYLSLGFVTYKNKWGNTCMKR